jgi:hypothetical protein
MMNDENKETETTELTDTQGEELASRLNKAFEEFDGEGKDREKPLIDQLNELAAKDPDVGGGDALFDSLKKEAEEAETAEPPAPREFFKCKKGHVTEGLYLRVCRTSEEDYTITHDSGPICRVCETKWYGKMFGAVPCKPPKEQ